MPEQTTTATDRFLTEREVEEMFGFARGVLTNNRHLGRQHPPFVRISNRAIRYRLSAVERWIESRTTRSREDA